MKLTKIATIGTLAISIAGLSACNNMMPAKTGDMKAPMHSQSMAKMNVVQVAQSNPDFSVLVEAVQAAGLVDMLSDPNAHYTVFAPTNAAFMQALQETGMTKAQLFANKPLLTKVLGYHVVAGDMAMYAKDVKPGNVMTASNGVVHVIDRVLLPK